MNNNPERLRRLAKLEDGCDISVRSPEPLMTLYEQLWALQYPNGKDRMKNILHERRVLATLAKEADGVDCKIPAGTNVRIVMVSRFGDVGITDETTRTHYKARVGNQRNPGNLEEWFTNVHFDN